ncbi:hypothetical protein GCM10007853_27460 [Algimonas ampicilliniresistens]|jgi:hypothetical protein|uniref:Putative auto-transporter adhesin head GIN domain-containing protein n=1 Tax=Algimonas ampicilliniresistens TaxID=1298735 RepID=A0ABQ5VD45_9PROT|nr:DUF2807 domain-containing protein [Algimonas ampicilliniresistens]GLQ24872.1 hypothetical protein GCM10007853_27460 [Algimonas ampicilliniresistens]
MKYLLAAAATTLLIAGTAVAHDGDNIERDVIADYDFRGFDSIDVSGVYELDVRSGKRFSVRTEATEDSAEWLEVKLKGDTLYLSKKNNHKFFDRDDDRHDHAVRVIVTMPKLTDLDVSGVASGEISAFTGGRISIDVGGVSDLTLSGACSRLNIDMGGVGKVDAEALKCDHVYADMGGVGKMSVYAAKSIKADSGGMSKIDVYGNPSDRDVESSRMAKVNIR